MFQEHKQEQVFPILSVLFFPVLSGLSPLHLGAYVLPKKLLPKRKMLELGAFQIKSVRKRKKSRKDTEIREMVANDSGDDELNVDQHHTEGQHNLQWMDTMNVHTSCAAGSGGHGQHLSLGAPVSAWPAECELVSPQAQHNGAGSSIVDTMRMSKKLFIYNTHSIWTVTSLPPTTHKYRFVE